MSAPTSRRSRLKWVAVFSPATLFLCLAFVDSNQQFGIAIKHSSGHCASVALEPGGIFFHHRFNEISSFYYPHGIFTSPAYTPQGRDPMSPDYIDWLTAVSSGAHSAKQKPKLSLSASPLLRAPFEFPRPNGSVFVRVRFWFLSALTALLPILHLAWRKRSSTKFTCQPS